jgi:HTH-type transcriptional regulator/antitoxin HipB
MIIRNSKELGAAIRKARLSKKLRQIELARKASMRQALISDLENGTGSATLDTMLKILAALDLDISIVSRKKAEFDPTEY